MIRALTIAVVTLAGFAAGTQQPQRDTASITPVRIGTASVSGVVTLGDEAQTPVRRAVVTMLASDGVETRSAVSDDQGRFTIGGLRAGRYTLSALKPAHLTTAYGARRPGRPGTALVITDGQSMRDLRVLLPRGAVMAGRLTMENGEPLPNIQVLAIPMRLATAGGEAAAAQEFRTDDRGEFRIYGLLPDSYLIAALPTFSRGEIQRRSDQEFDSIMRRLQQRSAPAAGQPAGTRSAPLEATPKTGYAPTYFPGTAVAANATPTVVKAGDVRDGLSFTVSLVPMATVSGTVVSVDGTPTQAMSLSMEAVGPPLPQTVFPAPRLIRSTATGEFSIAGVGPGRYRLRARAGGVTLRPDGSTASIDLAAQTQWGLSEMTVTGADIAGVTLALQPGRTFSGSLVAEGAAVPASPAPLKGAIVAVQPVTLGGSTSSVATRQMQVGEDGRFIVGGLEPYDYEVRVTLPAALAGWTLASVRHQGHDLRDAPVTFADGSLDGVEVVLTTAVTELTGRLTSESGTPATDYYIVAFPDNRALWHPASPRVRIMRPAADGLFSTRDLPPGTYRLAALIDVEDDEPRRRDFLESIYDAAIPVTVKAATSTKQDIRIR